MIVEPQESSDLLRTKSNALTSRNGRVSQDQSTKYPPDGGCRAYSVMIGSFLINGLLFGFINSYSVVYTVLKDKLNQENVPNSESRASLVGSLTIGATFFLSPLSGVLTGLMGLRLTAVLGGSIAAAGLLISSFVINYVDALCFTYGIMYGLGASMAYTPSLAILGHYFKRHLGLVNGVVTIGSSVFTVIMPPLMTYLIENHGLHTMFRIVALFTVGISLCGLLFKPTPLMVIEKPLREDDSFKSIFKTIIDIQIWKNRKYRLWALSMPVALFGYFVPYVHIKAYIKQNFPGVNGDLPLQCMAATTGVGRLLFGFLSDKRGVNRIMLQQISFYVIGTLTIILPFVESFPLFVVVTSTMGIFDGAFIALIGPIAFEFCGSAHAAQAIGCMLGLAAAPLSLGPMIAGYLYDQYNKSYTVPFVLAGMTPLIGASLMFSVHFHKRGYKDPSETARDGHVAAVTIDSDKAPGPLIQSNGNIHNQTSL